MKTIIFLTLLFSFKTSHIGEGHSMECDYLDGKVLHDMTCWCQVCNRMEHVDEEREL